MAGYGQVWLCAYVFSMGVQHSEVSNNWTTSAHDHGSSIQILWSLGSARESTPQRSMAVSRFVDKGQENAAEDPCGCNWGRVGGNKGRHPGRVGRGVMMARVMVQLGGSGNL